MRRLAVRPIRGLLTSGLGNVFFLFMDAGSHSELLGAEGRTSNAMLNAAQLSSRFSITLQSLGLYLSKRCHD